MQLINLLIFPLLFSRHFVLYYKCWMYNLGGMALEPILTKHCHTRGSHRNGQIQHLSHEEYLVANNSLGKA